MSNKSIFLLHFTDLTWDLTPEVIENRSLDLLDDIMERIDEITCLSEEQINFQSVCESLADMEAEMQREISIIEVYYLSSPVCQMRDKCLELRNTWSDFFVEMSMRRDLYDLLTKVKSIEKSLPYESARYLEKLLLYKRRDGLHLEADVREKLTDLLIAISNLCIGYNQNISDVDTRIEFEKIELFGMPEEFLNDLAEKDGKYAVTLKSAHVVPILKKCKVIKTRQIIEKAYNSRCMDKNIKILHEVIKLREERAKILGYETHADYVTEILMSKSSATVNEFLTSMFDKIQDGLKKEMKRLLELKSSECLEMRILFDRKIHAYDCSYYENMVKESDYHVNENLIKEFFPFEHVTAQLFDIYQTVLGLIFEQVKDPPVIHPDVSLYAVYDKATHSLMGYFYMDLFQRPFKSSNVACIGIQAACHFKNVPHIGCAVMIASFSKPLLEKPSLLTHEELITYFHEFGHVMHHICSKTRYKIFHGTSVERDFLEAPSQMLENWCWERDSLKKYDNSNNLAKLIEALEECMIYFTGIEPTPGTNFAASFGHLCGGYDAQYYSYLWSQVYAYDMFSRFKTEGIFSSEPGLSFRYMILLPGSTEDGIEMLSKFLGRPPIINPFMDFVGIKKL